MKRPPHTHRVALQRTLQKLCAQCVATVRPRLTVFLHAPTLPPQHLSCPPPIDPNPIVLLLCFSWCSVLAQLALTLCVNPIVNNSKDGDASVLFAGAMGASIGLIFSECLSAIC